MALKLMQGFEQLVLTAGQITFAQFRDYLGLLAPTHSADWFINSTGGVSDASGPMVIDSDVRIGGKALRIQRPDSGATHNPSFNGAYDLDLRYAFDPNASLACVGFAVKFDKLPAQPVPLVQFSYDDGASDDEQFCVWLSASGILFLAVEDYDVNATSPQTVSAVSGASSAYGAVTLRKWTYIEVQADFSVSGTPVITVAVNGVTVLSLIDVAGTKKETEDLINVVRIINAKNTYYPADSYTMLLDDIYILDNAGSDLTAMLGPQHIEAVVPSSNTQSEWTINGSGVSNAAVAAADFDPDDLTNYLTNNGGADEDIYVISDLSGAYGTINAVAVSTFLEVDTGSETLTVGVVDGASSATQGITVDFTSPKYRQAIFYTAGDGIDWNAAKVNTMQISVAGSA